ncbi:MAG: helix-turn-helix domain-containing protein [Tabrizicola sp.]|nr:helix-turn-helix domain-containing protein [Tabrizicola sp.]
MDVTCDLNAQATIEDCRREMAAQAARHGHTIHLAQGSPVYFNGDPAREVYCVQKGALRLSRLLCDGRRQILSFAFPGEVIGLAHDGTHHTDCEVLNDAVLSVLPTGRFAAIAHADPALASAMLRLAAQEMHDMQGHLVLLGQKSAIERLASFLALLGGRAGAASAGWVCFDLPMSRTDIGDYLGMSVETVSRAMTRLRVAGLVHLPRPDRVCLSDLAALTGFAEGEAPAPARYAA